MTNQETDLGYPDLQDADYVFRALLGHGMFSQNLPPCFTSEDLLDCNLEQEGRPIPCDYIRYLSTRHTSVPRAMGIPHPMAYHALCKQIKRHWHDINKHIGKPDPKINRIHVKKIPNKSHIFEMNTRGYNRYKIEAEDIKNIASCHYIVRTDISNFFSSIYSHSLPWAVLGKRQAKGRPKYSGTWADKLDKYTQYLKYNETNGLLIGPHASNILSDIILSAVDQKLLKAGFKTFHRHIDDYTFYADNQKNAAGFLKNLLLALKEYDLSLNAKKTNITSVTLEYSESSFITKLYQFNFPPTDSRPIGFTSVNAFIEYVLEICQKNNEFRALAYAIKLFSSTYGKILSSRACKLYAQKIFGIAIHKPYLLPFLELDVIRYLDITAPRSKQHIDILEHFTCSLLAESLTNGNTDAIAFSMYYMIKYDIKKTTKAQLESILKINDCISMTLAYEYAKKNQLPIGSFKDKAKELSQDDQSRDQYWLFIYQVFTENWFKQRSKEISASKIPYRDNKARKMKFMAVLKSKKVSFIKL